MYTCNPLKEMPNAKAAILSFNDGIRQLRSYSTIVAEVDQNGWVYVYGPCSPTACKYFSAFMAEIVNLDSHQAKTLYKDGARYNIYTGEQCNIYTCASGR